ncbi:hypothetical protein TIFTF001_011987 [Ficus carica]|uniref:Uncharacterized protein n=1 Tax=Ficus carica TaxID=3494 RepID=A0AA88A1J9_FICCA|nr:hypothetical protein TIFTF001_011987 [Ficus carica]
MSTSPSMSKFQHQTIGMDGTNSTKTKEAAQSTKNKTKKKKPYLHWTFVTANIDIITPEISQELKISSRAPDSGAAFARALATEKP